MSQSNRHTAIAGAALFAAGLVAAASASAASQRTFVATSGVDNLACSLASPCRTFTAALTATNAGGEVIVLNSGGYGGATITQSVSIIAPPGVYAGISVSAGNGIVVNTAAGDSVTLRGLAITNIGTGGTGIRSIGDGKLHIEDVHVTGFTVEGILFAPPSTGDLIVERSDIGNCGWGVVVTPTGTSATALLDRVSTHHNVNSGIQAGDQAIVVVRGSTSTSNLTGAWVYGATQGFTGIMTIETSDLSHNTTGAVVGGLAGTGAMTISNSVLTQNTTGLEAADNGTVLLAGTSITRNTTGIAYSGTSAANSQGNNLISGNGTDGTDPTVVGSK